MGFRKGILIRQVSAGIREKVSQLRKTSACRVDGLGHHFKKTSFRRFKKSGRKAQRQALKSRISQYVLRRTLSEKIKDSDLYPVAAQLQVEVRANPNHLGKRFLI